MADQKRTLSIVARLEDLASRNLATLGRTFQSTTRTMASDIAAPFRALGGMVDRLATLRNAVIGFAGIRLAQGVGRVFEDLSGLDDSRAKIAGTASSVSALAYALRLSGTSLDKVLPNLEAFARSVESARAGSDAKARALAKLGVSIESVSGSEIDYVHVLATVAESFSSLESATERATALQDVFGQSSSSLIPVLKAGAAGVRELADEAQRRGQTITQQELDRAKQFGDAIDRLGTGWERLTSSLALAFEPVLTGIIEKTTDLIDQLNRLLGLSAEASAAGAAANQARYSKQGMPKLLEELRAEANSRDAAANLPSFSPEALQAMQGTLGRAYDAAQRGATPQLPVVERILPKAQDALAFREAMNSLKDPSIATEIERVRITAEQQKLAFQESFEAGKIGAAELAQAMQQVDAAALRATAALQGDFAQGFTNAATAGVEAFVNMTKIGEEAANRLVTGGLNNLTDGLASVIDGTKSGKEAFKDFARSMLSDLSKIVARLLVVKTLSMLGKAIGGGVGDLLQGVTKNAEGGVMRGRLLATRKFADGGIANGPTLGLFGEAGAEAFVPLRSGKIPVSITNRGQDDGLHVHFAVEAVDAASVRQLFTAEREHLAGLVQNAINTRKGLRQTVRRAVR